MARVNITMPDDLVDWAKQAGVNISALATTAVAAAQEDQNKIAELDAYLAELEAELGPISPEELAAADAWIDRLEAEHRRVHGE